MKSKRLTLLCVALLLSAGALVAQISFDPNSWQLYNFGKWKGLWVTGNAQLGTSYTNTVWLYGTLFGGADGVKIGDRLDVINADLANGTIDHGRTRRTGSCGAAALHFYTTTLGVKGAQICDGNWQDIPGGGTFSLPTSITSKLVEFSSDGSGNETASAAVNSTGSGDVVRATSASTTSMALTTPTIGGGGSITKVYTFSFSVGGGSVAANTCTSGDVTGDGSISSGDTLTVNFSTPSPDGITHQYNHSVASGANITTCNHTTGSLTDSGVTLSGVGVRM